MRLNVKKTLAFLFLAVVLFLPGFVKAQTPDLEEEITETKQEIFEAKVIEIMRERELSRPGGSLAKQQNLRLKGLTGSFKDQEVVFYGISEIDVASAQNYKVGDKVVVNYIENAEGQDEFFILDFVRRGYLYLLAAIFALTVLAVGKWKGVKSIIGLVLSFVVIMYFILPLIIRGSNPLLVGLVGAFLILTIIIYITEGFNSKAHLAVISILLSLSITLFLSWLFTRLTRLTGLAQEEAVFLIGATGTPVNFQGLLLAGILIGAVGVLDDVIVGQIEAVQQIREANPSYTTWQTFRSAYAIGNTHLGAIVNTLFLTYTGASLPLLLLFKLNQNPPVSFGQAINNEVIATEVVRTLVGSIGVALSLPIATFLAAFFVTKKGK